MTLLESYTQGGIECLIGILFSNSAVFFFHLSINNIGQAWFSSMCLFRKGIGASSCCCGGYIPTHIYGVFWDSLMGSNHPCLKVAVVGGRLQGRKVATEGLSNQVPCEQNPEEAMEPADRSSESRIIHSSGNY